MHSDYIFKYSDAQKIEYPNLKFVQLITPLFGVFQPYGRGDYISLELARVSLNEYGIKMLEQNPDSVNMFLNSRVLPWDDVVAFHKKFGIDYDGPPRMLDAAYEKFRGDTLKEELKEYFDAEDDEQRFDALIDLIYFALGTIRLRGWNFPEGWRRVQVKNMAKELAVDAKKSRRGFGLDVIKPPGWTPPDLSDLVKIPAEFQQVAPAQITGGEPTGVVGGAK